MPRPLRPIADGSIYHVINRGNNRQAVCDSEGDFAAFLKAVGDLKKRKPCELYGYCLMTNYVHQAPEEAELAAIRRSSATGLPFGESAWVNRLARKLKLDLAIRPRGRLQKDGAK